MRSSSGVTPLSFWAKSETLVNITVRVHRRSLKRFIMSFPAKRRISEQSGSTRPEMDQRCFASLNMTPVRLTQTGSLQGRVSAIVFDKPPARSLHPARVAKLDRSAAAFPARAHGVAAPVLLLRPRDWFLPTTPLRSSAAGRLRKQTGSFLFRRLIEKSAACPPATSRQANLALLPREIMNAPRGKSFQKLRGGEFCHSAIANPNIRQRDPQSVVQ